MSATSPFTPFFLDVGERSLFAIFYPARKTTLPKGFILHVPAFAEEMNKSRRMVALQAQRFADDGYAVLIVDLSGTGDSTGDFSDATWLLWKQDIAAACQWLSTQGASSVILWGLRVGVLLALDCAADNLFPVDRLLCWQPVLNGDLFVTQFLRLRIAAAMMDKNAPQEKTADLKQQLLDGHTIEVAGYRLNPDLISPLLALSASSLSPHVKAHTTLIEVSATVEKPIPVNTVKWAEQRQNLGLPVALSTVVGDAFWSTQEITEAPELLISTVHCLNNPTH